MDSRIEELTEIIKERCESYKGDGDAGYTYSRILYKAIAILKEIENYRKRNSHLYD